MVYIVISINQLKTLILPYKKQNLRYYIDFLNRKLHTKVYPHESHFFGFFVFIFATSGFVVALPHTAKASLFETFFSSVSAQIKNISSQNTQTMPLPSPETQFTVIKKEDKPLQESSALSAGLLVSEIGPVSSSTQTDTDIEDDTIYVYKVHKGDSLEKIAKLFDVSPNTIRWANNLKKNQNPKEGDSLVILPVSGVSYVIKKGDTLARISKKFNADVDEVGAFNGLDVDSELAYGETIIIPDGEIEEKKTTTKSKNKVISNTKKLVAGATKLIKGFDGVDTGGYYIRPIAGGVRTQGLHGKNGVDIGASLGTPVYASAGGTAIVAKTGGYNGGYGNYIILSHSNGTQTIYGHLQTVFISPGESVSRGQQIGSVGNTGRSTGPHLHFEVRGAKNPLGDNPRYGL